MYLFQTFGSDAGAEPGGGKFPGNLIVQLVQSRVWCLRSGAQDVVSYANEIVPAALFYLLSCGKRITALTCTS